MGTNEQHAIYRDHALEYDALVSAEDHDENLRATLLALLPSDGPRVLDVGGGTGRITRTIADHASAVTLLDRHPAMLEVARTRCTSPSPCPIDFVTADARSLPFADARFDAAIAGWVFGHFGFWNPDTWSAEVDTALAELERVVRPSGAILIIETLGTGVTAPKAPNQTLARYHRRLENSHQFHKIIIKTDYQFDSLEEAVARIGFFFGPTQAERVRSTGSPRVREFTGVWWRQRGQAQGSARV